MYGPTTTNITAAGFSDLDIHLISTHLLAIATATSLDGNSTTKKGFCVYMHDVGNSINSDHLYQVRIVQGS